MFKNYLKIAFRNLWKDKVYSAINIGGLAIGLTSCILLLLYVAYEWSFDSQFKELNKIFVVERNQYEAGGRIITYDDMPNPLSPVIKQSVPEVEYAARINGPFKTLISYEQNSFRKEGSYADSTYFDIFNYHFLEGDPRSALTAPDAIVLTQSLAKILFGKEDPMDKLVRIDNKQYHRVTGIIEDIPFNTSVRFDYLLSWYYFEKQNPGIKTDWGDYMVKTFVKLKSNTSVEKANRLVRPIINAHYKDTKMEAFLYPLSKWHLYSEFENGKAVGGKIDQLRLFILLALGILLIACINFMNLSTARSEKRAKEVGIKKTVGASRGMLIVEFIGESFLLTLISVFIAAILVELTLPFFNHALGAHLSFQYENLYYWAGLVLLTLITSLIAGSYPAFYLSSFRPGIILKKKHRTGKPVLSIRQILVVIQFSFVVILIISTIVIYYQIQYIKNRPTGYNMNSLIQIGSDAFLTADGSLTNNFSSFRNELLQSGAVTAVCPMSNGVTDNESHTWGVEWAGMAPGDDQIVFDQIATTYGFTKTLGVKIKDGRDFSEDFAGDSSAVMLNEAAVKAMHLQNPVGTMIKWHYKQRKVVGVFENFVWGSPFKQIPPMIVGFVPDWIGVITLRLNPQRNISSSLAEIKNIYKKMNPAYPFHYDFIDNAFAAKFKTEKNLGLLSNLFGGLAILISCLGLLGLAAFSAEQRTREIGIRKVLGATDNSIILLLSVNFIKLVILANIIGCILAGWLLHKWLMQYTYKVSLSWWVFGIAGLLSILIALLTVSMQAWKAAKANPVEALKYE